MAKAGAFHRSITLQAFTVLSVLAVLVADVKGGDGCQNFSCGHLQDVRSPFRRRGDPPRCGSQNYELACTDSTARIQINTAAYLVTEINYTGSSFWVVDANLDMNSSCPLPRSDQLPYFEGIPTRSGSHKSRDRLPYFEVIPRSHKSRDRLPYSLSNCPIDSHGRCNLATGTYNWACFVNCSRAITNNSGYMPIACLSAKNSHVYVLAADGSSCLVEDLEPFCGYLAMIPFGSYISTTTQVQNASYADIIGFIRKGFSVQFPGKQILGYRRPFVFEVTNICLNNSVSYFKQQISDASILNWTRTFFWGETHFLECIGENTDSMYFIVVVEAIISAIDIPKFLVVLCRFVLAPLAVLIFLAHKYWKTRITIDAVEKFLRMQQMLCPTRYAYTDITAITSHLRDKLGQGGYGSVYKGVLLPGEVHVAVKMLEGNSNCNGEDFISEVSTIGRIHHVNVVCLVGFCSEEMRRALVYEYMPRGSLDRYIFSAEKIFSWDKLNGIALGIARGINYLHQGCEMQILHFDIKPHNILLDSNFIPKVADFGLAKLCPRGNSFVPLSALRGTVGYIAPEMISRSFGVISSKSDVYSFGMLLLEMAGGRRNADPNATNSSQAYYPSWVYDRLTEQKVYENEISSAAAEMHELERKLCIVGLWCIQMKSHDRPTMSEVIEMLETGADGLQMPSRPFFCDEGHIHIEDSLPIVRADRDLGEG